MSYSRLILRDSAEIVWPLDDITESSSVSQAIQFLSNYNFSNSASINISNTNILSLPIVFGGGKALSFTSSAVGLSIPALNRLSELHSNKNSCISFWLKIDNLTTKEQVIFKKRNFDNMGLFIKDNYLIFKYGNNSNYTEVAGYLENPNEPNHIVLSKTPNYMYLIINGNTFSPKNYIDIALDKDPSHLNNNYFDFYGPINGSWTVDSIAFYSNPLDWSIAKRHYVYGLGKNFGDDIFYSRGGSIYNLSSIDTEKLINLNWSSPKRWYSTTINNLQNTDFGIRSMQFSEPDLYSYESEIQTSSNSIIFRNTSGSISTAAYIDIDTLFNKIGNSDDPFFVQVKLDGPLPQNFEKQRIVSIGEKPDEEFLKFNLYNNSGSYQLMVEALQSSSITFNIENIQNSPHIYIGMNFINESKFYFIQEGASAIIKTLNYTDNDGYGLDPLSSYFPLAFNKIIRIGSSLTYDRNNFSDRLPSVEQFGGTFKKFFVYDNSVTSSVTYSNLENYNQSKYQITFDTILNRFKNYSYGNVTFNIHGINIGEFISDTDQRIGANFVGIGYPHIPSSSQVLSYVTHLDYSGSVVYPKTKIYDKNYLSFINNKNLSGTYLKFDIDIYGEDVNYYPPNIKFFSMETYKQNNNKVVMRNDGGRPYTLYPSSSSIFIPELKRTPNIFITNDSGIKLLNTIADFTDNFSAKPLNPETIPGLKLWLDSRFTNGLRKISQNDDSIVNFWSDLSFNNNHATQQTSSVAPIFRIQSQNLFTNNQANGGELNNTFGITSVNSLINTSTNGVITGFRSIEISPDTTSIDSYIHMNYNTASISISPNQNYSVLGSITIPRVQSASAFHSQARGISVFVYDGISLNFTASIQAPNIPGTYNLKTTFSTSSSAQYAEIRFYNGSFKKSDIVYWDNLGLYLYSSSFVTSSWSLPGSSNNDMPVIKFNNKHNLISSASINQPYTLYLVGRATGDGNLIGFTASGLSLYVNSSILYIKSINSASIAAYNNLFNVYTLSVNSGSADIYINNNFISNKYIGSSPINNLVIGSGEEGGFRGDIAAILLYSDTHNTETIDVINDWLKESFRITY